jgi:hypothetical protein
MMVHAKEEAQIEGLWSEAGPRQIYRILPEKYLKVKKGLRTWPGP